MKSKSGNFQSRLLLFLIFSFSNLFSFGNPIETASLYLQIKTVSTPAFINECSLTYNRSSLLFADPVFNTPRVYSDTIRKKDRDGDSVPDSLDKCPDDKGVLLYDGCPVPDTDNDGISDESDLCPTVAGPLKFKGCPAGDSDGDKINDELDKCPSIPGVARFEGCLIGDKDGDGLNDEVDKCVDVAGSVENQGCPETRKPAVPKRKEKKSIK